MQSDLHKNRVKIYPRHKASRLQSSQQTLAHDETQATHQLIRITRHLNALAEREYGALAQKDMAAFTLLQEEKALYAKQYEAASREFRNRISDFRNVSPALLDRLEILQKRLGDNAQKNDQSMQRLLEDAIPTDRNPQQEAQPVPYHNTLLSAQEIAQESYESRTADLTPKTVRRRRA